MDKRAQVSAEFVLLVGFILVIVLVFASIISEQSELNSILASARTGASDAVAEIFLLDRGMGPVRVEGIDTVGTDNITIRIRLSSSVSSYYQDLIRYRTLNSMAAQGYTLVNNTTIVTSRHTYQVIIL